MRPTTPVEEGAEMELTLVEVGLFDSRAAVGKVGDYEVNVPDSATLVGKKVKARIERSLAGGGSFCFISRLSFAMAVAWPVLGAR